MCIVGAENFPPFHLVDCRGEARLLSVAEVCPLLDTQALARTRTIARADLQSARYMFFIFS
ncbi:MAG: hypothetical protein LBN27_01255 [Prevotellaceae bacterium]|nr:hypothetical protein [Prevotellaceae bacterium]